MDRGAVRAVTAGVATAEAVRPEFSLPKAPTGIRGFDEVTGGGLPRGRPTLVTGAAGTGKTLFALEFLIRGARDFGEPGVVMTFEESERDLTDNVASLGLGLDDLVAQGLVACDAMRLDPTQVVAAGSFDLEGLFIRLAAAVDSVGAKRVVIDTIEVLFGALGNEAIVRGEFARLLRWLKDRGLTAVITGERGREGQLTRSGIEEYVSDCVIVLDHRVQDEVATRRVRVAKYRGSHHGTNEYPFMITDRGFTVMPLTSVRLTYAASTERVSLGIPRLDDLLGGGIYRGSTVLVTGSAGTGKSGLAAHAVAAACARGEQALYVSFEESPAQIVRNMASLGIDLGHWVDAGLLNLWCERATAAGLESHLDVLEQLLERHRPSLVVIDSIGSLGHVGTAQEVSSIIARHIDRLKRDGTTAILTSLTSEVAEVSTRFDVSSLIDTWLLLRNVEAGGERNRLLFVIKSRGTWHSNQVREFVLTDHGAELLEVQIGPDGVLTGSARFGQLVQETASRAAQAAELTRQRETLAVRRLEVEAQVEALLLEVQNEERQLEALAVEYERQAQRRTDDDEQLLRQRQSPREPGEAIPR